MWLDLVVCNHNDLRLDLVRNSGMERPESRACYRMERKILYRIGKMPEWNGMEDFKNGMENNFPSFHTKS